MAGILATGADLTALAILVQLAHLTPLQANVPSLLAGAIVNFIGNRVFAFRARAGNAAGQFTKFLPVEIGAFGLNTFTFDSALRIWPMTSRVYLLVRLLTTGVVYLGWSYPLWHVVFPEKDRAEDPPDASRGRSST